MNKHFTRDGAKIRDPDGTVHVYASINAAKRESRKIQAAMFGKRHTSLVLRGKV